MKHVIVQLLWPYGYHIMDKEAIQDEVITDAVTNLSAIIEKQPNAGHPSGFIGPENAAIVAQKQVDHLRGPLIIHPLSCERG